LKDCAVDKAVAAHSIRNFQSREAIRASLREMNRVLSADGEMIVAENLPIARNRSQEAHLAVYRCKCKYGHGDLFYFSQKELLEIFREVGLTDVQVKIVDYDMSAAPPIFCLNTSTQEKDQIDEAKREFEEAIEMTKRYGETSPPVAIFKAKKRSE
jgi:hypothetical protein